MRTNKYTYLLILSGLFSLLCGSVCVAAEKSLTQAAPDGARIRVHFDEESLRRYGASADLPSDVLEAALHAYQTITDFQGFNSPGFSFMQSDARYADDPDKTIDVYLGDPSGTNDFPGLGLRNNLFKDAPCFDTIKISDTEYQAVILLPVNYHEFIRNWERINPSPMGRRNIRIDLRGTLIHEMLHAVLFYYNKNMNKSVDDRSMEGAVGHSQHLDWYVEGLARYFETFAGARHDFFSQGFKQTLPDKIRFSRGGSNYFMRYPDQAFTQLRYENALFWRYLDHRYGMAAIEELSRNFRSGRSDIRTALEQMTQIPFTQLLKDYAKAILFKDFGLKDDQVYLNDVARSRVMVDNNEWYLIGGRGDRLRLGRVYETDWIGQWEDVHVEFSDASAAGDNTRVADVSGWATDYTEISKSPSSDRWPKFNIHHSSGSGELLVQVFGETKGGSTIEKSFPAVKPGHANAVDLSHMIRAEGLGDDDVEKIHLLITNTDPEQTSEYSFQLLS